MIRARLALLAEQADTVLATLNEIAGRAGRPKNRRPRQQALVRQANKLLDALVLESRLERRIAELRGRLVEN